MLNAPLAYSIIRHQRISMLTSFHVKFKYFNSHEQVYDVSAVLNIRDSPLFLHTVHFIGTSVSGLCPHLHCPTKTCVYTLTCNSLAHMILFASGVNTTCGRDTQRRGWFTDFLSWIWKLIYKINCPGHKHAVLAERHFVVRAIVSGWLFSI